MAFSVTTVGAIPSQDIFGSAKSTRHCCLLALAMPGMPPATSTFMATVCFSSIEPVALDTSEEMLLTGVTDSCPPFPGWFVPVDWPPQALSVVTSARLDAARTARRTRGLADSFQLEASGLRWCGVAFSRNRCDYELRPAWESSRWRREASCSLLPPSEATKVSRWQSGSSAPPR